MFPQKTLTVVGLLVTTGLLFTSSLNTQAASAAVTVRSSSSSVRRESAVFCELRANGTFRYRGSQASFDSNGNVYIMPVSTPRLANGDCDPTRVTQIRNIPAFSRHTTRFRVTLEGNTASVENVTVSNSAPGVARTMVCVLPGRTAVFNLVDPDRDRVQVWDIYALNNRNDVDINFTWNQIRVTGRSDFVGDVELVAELADPIIASAGVINPAISRGSIGSNARIVNVVGSSSFSSPVMQPVRVNLTAIFRDCG